MNAEKEKRGVAEAELGGTNEPANHEAEPGAAREQEERSRIIDGINESFASTLADESEATALREERAAWDVTMSDGLDNEPPENLVKVPIVIEATVREVLETLEVGELIALYLATVHERTTGADLSEKNWYPKIESLFGANDRLSQEVVAVIHLVSNEKLAEQMKREQQE